MSSETVSNDAIVQKQDQQVLVVDHPELTFPDGDIVLLSAVDPKTRRQTKYRVHRHILRIHSSVFKDLFSSCISTGIPEVTLDDTARVLESLLSYIYADGKNIYTPTYASLFDYQDNIGPVLEVVSVADKYAVHNLENFLLSSMTQEIETWERAHLEWEGDDKSYSQYYGPVSFDYGMHLLAYADRVDNGRFRAVALLIGLACLDEENQDLESQNLSRYNLSLRAEVELYRFHHSKQKARADAVADRCRDEAAESDKQYHRMEALSQAPETSSSHALTCPNWAQCAIPAYYRALNVAIKRMRRSYSRELDPRETKKEMRSANFGDCQVCVSAVRAHIDGMSWK